MTSLTMLQLVPFVFLSFLCVYALINRICQCIEHCATAKAYGKFRENDVRMEDVNKNIQKGFNDAQTKA